MCFTYLLPRVLQRALRITKRVTSSTPSRRPIFGGDAYAQIWSNKVNFFKRILKVILPRVFIFPSPMPPHTITINSSVSSTQISISVSANLLFLIPLAPGTLEYTQYRSRYNLLKFLKMHSQRNPVCTTFTSKLSP